MSHRIVQVLATALTLAAPALGQPWPPSTHGQWDSLRQLNFQAIHLILAPSGRLVMLNFLNVKVYDPITDQTVAVYDYPSPANYFCGAHVVLPSGLILFASGGLQTTGEQFAHTFNPDTGEWLRMDDLPMGMRYPDGPIDQDMRWYATLTVLGPGKVLLTAGRDQDLDRDRDCDGNIITFVEDVPCIFDPAEAPGQVPPRQWRRLGENFSDHPTDPGARRPLQWYPFCYSLSDGTVCAAGSYWAKLNTLFKGDPTPGAPYPCDDVVDPAFHVATVKLDLTVPGSEDWMDVNANAAIPGGSAVMYRPDKILKAGGGYHTRGFHCKGNGGHECTTDCGWSGLCLPSQCGTCCICETLNDGLREAYTIDMGADTPQWVPTEGGGLMLKKRRQFTLVTMPDGKVLAMGGWGKNATGDVEPVMEAEWYDPQPFAPDTPGPWEALAPMNQSNPTNENDYRREDHSTAVVLGDARLFVAGGQYVGACFGGTCFQTSAQIFKPPYLFDAAGNDISENMSVRPEIAITWGSTDLYYSMSVNAGLGGPYANAIKRVVLLRLGAVTHQFDQNARYVPLTFSVVNNQTLRIFPPSNRHKAPPGHYMLFVLKQGDRTGILFPSKALIVNLKSDLTPIPP